MMNMELSGKTHASEREGGALLTTLRHVQRAISRNVYCSNKRNEHFHAEDTDGVQKCVEADGKHVPLRLEVEFC